MSIFASAETWAESSKGCGAPHQSPVNLSRSFALPCDRLCELQIDKVAVPQATAVIKSETGMMLEFGDVKPTAKFNGEGYTCKNAYLFHPAQHTIEDVRAEAEFVAVFENPKGYTLAVSVPVRTAPGETPSTSFFNSFVGYPSQAEEPTQVNLGTQWMLQDIIPESKGFYVYEGSWVTPPCTAEVTWCVFNTAVTMDPSDFAKLSSRATGGNRPLQPVGDREVFFNDGEKIESAFQKKDGKMYMRCRRIPREGETPRDAVKTSDLENKVSDITSKTQAVAISNLQTNIGDLYASVGGVWGMLMVVSLLLITYTLFGEKGETLSRSLFGFLMYIPAAIHNAVFYVLSFVGIGGGST